jgi:hypothetical protein
MTNWEQRAEAAKAYHGAAMRLAEKTTEVEQELREDVEAGWLSPRQADVILAGIVADDDANADWPWKRWKEARRVRDGKADETTEWAGADGLADHLDEYLDGLDP